MSSRVPPSFINFNFGTQWDKVVPFLQTRRMKKLLEKVHGMIRDNHDFPQNWKPYDHTKAPAEQLTTHDGYIMQLDQIKEHYIKIKDVRIPPTVVKKLDELIDMREDSNDDDEEEYFNMLHDIEDKVMRAVNVSFDVNPTHIVHWLAFGTCHWFNVIIGLYLAKKVCPSTNWKVRVSDDHSTVISDDGKMFDILAWGWNQNRFNAACMQLEDTETDVSLGANEVMIICFPRGLGKTC
jgi:hypothetical protein